MPSFHYVAIRPGGDVQRGVMEAPASADVIARLQQQGSLPIRAELSSSAGRPAPGWAGGPPDRGRLRKHEVAELLRDLATMLSAGQDLSNALKDVQAVSPSPRVRRLVAGLRDAVSDGCPLSSALGQHGGSFGHLHVGLVRAGEAGGQLTSALTGLAELLERQRELAATIRSALIYPGLLLTASVISVGLLLTRVLPQFVPMFEQSNARLPSSTRALIGFGDFIADYGGLCAVVLAGGGLLARVALRQPGPRRVRDRVLLRLPVVGPLRREIAAARFSRVFGTLLLNGVPLIGAIVAARDSISDTVVAEALGQAEASARSGAGICQTLEDNNVFPLRTVQLLRLGERNARLGPMSLRAADMHEAQVRVITGRLVSLLVPGITVVMGAVVAGIVAAIMTAMLGLNELTVP